MANLVPEDISEGVRLYYVEQLAYSIQGVNGKGWSRSRKQGQDADDGNELMTELYIGDWGEIIEIGDYAFYGSHNLKNIRLPSMWFGSIGAYSFAECSSLRIADLRNCSGLHYIGHHAFENCSSMEKVILPRVSEIHSTAFNGCTSL